MRDRMWNNVFQNPIKMMYLCQDSQAKQNAGYSLHQLQGNKAYGTERSGMLSKRSEGWRKCLTLPNNIVFKVCRVQHFKLNSLFYNRTFLNLIFIIFVGCYLRLRLYRQLFTFEDIRLRVIQNAACLLDVFRLRKVWQKRKCSVKNGYLTISHGTVRERSNPTAGLFLLTLKNHQIFSISLLKINPLYHSGICLCSVCRWQIRKEALEHKYRMPVKYGK